MTQLGGQKGGVRTVATGGQIPYSEGQSPTPGKEGHLWAHFFLR